MPQRPCPLCSHGRARHLAQLDLADFDGVELSGSVHVITCASCGFAFNDLPGGQSTLDTFYSRQSLYCASIGVGAGGYSPMDLLRYEQMYGRIKPFVPANGASIADIGCAKGGFLRYLSDQGHRDVMGVDLSAGCVAHINQQTGQRAYLGGATSLEVLEQAPDLLVYSHILEHVYDPLAALRQARQHLAPAGHVYIEVPDAERYGSEPIFDFYWFSQREHINHFDLPHLEQLCRVAGLRVVERGRTSLFLTAQAPTPVIYVVAEVAASSPADCPGREMISTSTALHGHLQAYVQAERSRLPWRNQQLQRLKPHRRAHAWGVGLEFFYLYSHSELQDCNLVGLIDNNANKQTMTVCRLPIESSDRLRSLGAEHAVVITSVLHRQAMKKQLAQLGYRGQVVDLVAPPPP